MTTDIQPPATSAATSRFSDPIELVEPIVRGETRITSLILRKPKSGELRGLTLQDLLTTDVTTIITLVPRISDPILTDAEARELDPADLAEIGGVIRGFFLTRAERALIEKMTSGEPISTI
jgi:hypothetical protein